MVRLCSVSFYQDCHFSKVRPVFFLSFSVEKFYFIYNMFNIWLLIMQKDIIFLFISNRFLFHIKPLINEIMGSKIKFAVAFIYLGECNENIVF